MVCSENCNYWINSPFIPAPVQEQVQPFLLPYDHSARTVLDQNCVGLHFTEELTDRGFTKLSSAAFGRTVRVMTHSKLQEHGLIVKIPHEYYPHGGYMDFEI